MKRALMMGLAVALAGCIDDDSTSTPTPDQGSQLDGGALDASPPDATPDAAPVDAERPDANPEPTACETACDTLVRCALEQCEGLDAPQAEAFGPSCRAQCGENPALSTVINGAGACQTVVEFARSAIPDFGEACAPDTPEPEVCAIDTDCADDGTRQCEAGLCRSAQFSQCRDDRDCDGADQTCLNFSQNPLDPGACHIDCADGGDAICPFNQECVEAFNNICYFALCGDGYTNGPVFGACEVAGQEGGVCYPLPEGNRTAAGLPGVCLEGGDVPLGGACDAQALDRTPEDRALRCHTGICFGDPDDPTDPDAAMDGTGQCVALCDPRSDSCGEGQFCIDFSSPDDPATPTDETRHLGACVDTDCSALGDPTAQCGEGRGCRLYAATSDAGRCDDAGEAAPGEACAAATDCAGNQICGDAGVCIAPCPPGDEAACPDDQICYVADESWAVGFCIAAP